MVDKMTTKTHPNMLRQLSPVDIYTDYSASQIPPWDDDYSEPDYPFEAYM